MQRNDVATGPRTPAGCARTLDVTQSYVPVFIGIGLLMPVALVAGFALMRRVEPVKGLA